jgi:uncharacterized protein YuzE
VSAFRPSVTPDEGLLTVTLLAGSAATEMPFEGVIDQTDFGDVVGIEILDLRHQLSGATVPPTPLDGFLRWSYDGEIDAFYIRISDGAAQRQNVTTGTARVDAQGQLTTLELWVGP